MQLKCDNCGRRSTHKRTCFSGGSNASVNEMYVVV